jgi:hypothetical protein
LLCGNIGKDFEMIGSVGAGASFNLSSANSSGGAAAAASSDISSWVKERTSQLRAQFPDTSIAISPTFLKKMETDPAAAAKGKELLDGIPAAQDWLQNKIQQNGMKLISGGVNIDSEGNMSSWSIVQSSSSPDGSEKSSSQKLKEWLEKRHNGEPKATPLASAEDLFSRIMPSTPDRAQTTSNSNRVDTYA